VERQQFMRELKLEDVGDILLGIYDR